MSILEHEYLLDTSSGIFMDYLKPLCPVPKGAGNKVRQAHHGVYGKLHRRGVFQFCHKVIVLNPP
jgi:hypothetical protein